MTDSLATLDGSTRTVGLIGWPVSHSRSPAMHNAAFAALGLNYVYVPLPVPSARVGAAVKGLPALGFVGANVTVPHKAAVLPFLDAVSPAVRAIGAANTLIVRPDGTVLGDNTDAPAFVANLRAHGVEPAGLPALIVGAGGAARAVAYALAEVGAEVAVLNRTLERAEAVCRDVRSTLPDARISAHSFPEALGTYAYGAKLIVNATSLGWHDDDVLPWDSAVPFRQDQIAYDLVYTTARAGAQRPLTRWLALAARGGAQTLDGLGMLVYQGARAFELWTGQPAPVEVMAEAVGGRYHPHPNPLPGRERG